MAKVQVPNQPMVRERPVNRTCYPADIEAAMQARIKEGSDFGAFVYQWHRLLGPVTGISLVLKCSDQAVRSWFRSGVAPSATTRELMRMMTPKLAKLPDKAWATQKTWQIAAYLTAN
jgi:hypothetical protein